MAAQSPRPDEKAVQCPCFTLKDLMEIDGVASKRTHSLEYSVITGIERITAIHTTRVPGLIVDDTATTIKLKVAARE